MDNQYLFDFLEGIENNSDKEAILLRMQIYVNELIATKNEHAKIIEESRSNPEITKEDFDIIKSGHEYLQESCKLWTIIVNQFAI